MFPPQWEEIFHVNIEKLDDICTQKNIFVLSVELVFDFFLLLKPTFKPSKFWKFVIGLISIPKWFVQHTPCQLFESLTVKTYPWTFQDFETCDWFNFNT